MVPILSSFSWYLWEDSPHYSSSFGHEGSVTWWMVCKWLWSYFLASKWYRRTNCLWCAHAYSRQENMRYLEEQLWLWKEHISCDWNLWAIFYPPTRRLVGPRVIHPSSDFIGWVKGVSTSCSRSFQDGVQIEVSSGNLPNQPTALLVKLDNRFLVPTLFPFSSRPSYEFYMLLLVL